MALQHQCLALQDPAQTMTLNQLAGYTHSCMSSDDIPARTHVVRRSLSDIKHGSCCEIQLQSAESFIVNSAGRHTISPEPKQSQTAAPVLSRNSMLDSDDDGFEHGIELQEQRHAEMLEHALGEQPRMYCQSLNAIYSPGREPLSMLGLWALNCNP